MADENHQPMIVCKDVHKWYGHFHALQGINMKVQKGEVIVIFGPSGSGKSTFIRTLNRLEEHQKGTDHRRWHRADPRYAQYREDPHGDRHGLPAVQPVPAPDRAAEYHAGAHPGAQMAEGEGRGDRPAAAGAGGHPRTGATSTPASFPAGSSSAWPSPAPWPCSPRSCSSTSPPRPSTRR